MIRFDENSDYRLEIPKFNIEQLQFFSMVTKTVRFSKVKFVLGLIS